MEDKELTQTEKHRLERSGVNTSPELVAVVQYDENTKEAVLLLNNQILKDGDEVDYRGKKFPVALEVKFAGNVPDEVDHGVVDHYVSTDAWDAKQQTVVTTSEAVYAPKITGGRTVNAADVDLSVGGTALKIANGGKGGRTVCGDVPLRRWAFNLPYTVLGFNAAPKSGKKPIDE